MNVRPGTSLTPLNVARDTELVEDRQRRSQP